MEEKTDLWSQVARLNSLNCIQHAQIDQLQKENSSVKNKLEATGEIKCLCVIEAQLLRAQERVRQQRDEFKNKDMKLKAKIEALEEKALQASQNYEETEIM